MCDVNGISESYYDWDYFVNKQESSHVDFSSRKYSLNQQDQTSIFHITNHKPENHSLQGRSMFHPPMKEIRVDVNVDAEVKFTWGSKQGVVYSGASSVEVSNKDSYAKVEAWRNSSGDSGAEGSADFKKEIKR